MLSRYAVLGGTPQYQVWAGGARVMPAIEARVLRKGESLYEEPLHLLREEQRIRDPGTYFADPARDRRRRDPLQRDQAASAHRPNLDVMLARLEELGYVERRVPVGPAGGRPATASATPSSASGSATCSRRAAASSAVASRRCCAEIEADLDTFMGPAFEDCCREWVGRYAPADAIPRFDALGAWWSRTATSRSTSSRRAKSAPCCSARASGRRGRRSRCSTSCAASTAPRAAAADARLALFARGFTPALTRRASSEGVLLVSAADLFGQSRRTR